MKLRISFLSLFAFCVALGTLGFFVGTVFAADPPCPTCLINPLAASVNPDTPIQSLSAIFINALFGIAGSIALAMFVWGGMLWLTSAGNEKQVAKGKAIFQWTTLGVIMMFAAYALVSFLFSNLGTAPATTPAGGPAAGGGPTPAGTQPTSTAFCCIDYSNNTTATVTSMGACQGGQKEFASDPCDKLKFCDKSAQGYEACKPYGVNAQCLDGGKGYTSVAECMMVKQGGAQGPAPVAKKPYCCWNLTSAKANVASSDVMAASDTEAQGLCKTKITSGTVYAEQGSCSTHEWCYSKANDTCPIVLNNKPSSSCISVHSTLSACKAKMKD